MPLHSAPVAGPGQHVPEYVVPDDEVSAGSTLGGPKICAVIKATGAIEKVYSIDAGETLIGTVVVHHWDERAGIRLMPEPGHFVFRPESQEHQFSLSNGVHVRETIFVLSGAPDGDRVDPPAVYYAIRLHNESPEEVQIGTYAYCELRGKTDDDVIAVYDEHARSFIAWNDGKENARTFGISVKPASYETTDDRASALPDRFHGDLANSTDTPAGDPLAGFHVRHVLRPNDSVEFVYCASFASGDREAAIRAYQAVPDAETALQRTRAYYNDVLGRSVMITPDPVVNRGVLWAKANMLRTQLKPQTGWSQVNDPTNSNNAVARDTAWFAYGSDYITPEFSRASLLGFVERQEATGMIVEYYDIRNGETADYGLNVNDNTPLLLLGLWHHYSSTRDREFLARVYPAAAKAARFLLSQRNDQGLVWCTSTKTSDWGIVGWRNVIKNYRLSGATTELNSECRAAFEVVSNMARTLELHEDAEAFANEASLLRDAINEHLYNPDNGLYYLNIDVDGRPRTDVTSDLVFPIIFGVANHETAIRIITRLSAADFWTDAGMRTVPRDAPGYGATHGYGLLGGVWVGVTFWFSFAAARYNPEFTAHALSSSFRHYSRDPRKNNTVPGQFSEWLHGETLTNQGMMLSPWFPPRYLWAAIEGTAGLNLSGDLPQLTPRLAADWKWLGVRNVPFANRRLAWFVARVPNEQIYSTFAYEGSPGDRCYDDDITPDVDVTGQHTVCIALRKGDRFVVLAGNTADHTVTVACRIHCAAAGSYTLRMFNSLSDGWKTGETIGGQTLRSGLPIELERKGFAVLEFAPASP